MSNFAFLQSEWPQLFADAQKTEELVMPDPRAACFYARRTLELAVAWLYKSDPALKLPMDGFLRAKTLNATQIQFVNRVIEYLTQSGWMDPGQLYESPFTDFSPKGVEGVFSPEQVGQLIGILKDVRQRAAAA